MRRPLPSAGNLDAVRTRALRGAILLVVVTLALAGAAMWVNLPG